MSRPRRTVRMNHPATGGSYTAPVSAVPALQRSGWVAVDDVPGITTSPAEPAAPPAGDDSGTEDGGEDGGRYDEGGDLQPGMTAAKNSGDQPEPVTPEPKPRRGRRTTKED